jgi:hypothetical protein
MSKNSTFTVACALCVGADPEPYLPATLASIASAVDVLVVNDNSGLARSTNVATLEGLRLRGARRAARRTASLRRFRRHAQSRVRCPGPRCRARPTGCSFWMPTKCTANSWATSRANCCPRLGPQYGNLDAFTYHFWGTFGWITDIARRFVFYRYAPELRWTNAVHEKVTGLRGRALVVPYVYHHYGNVQTPAALTRKHLRYYDLGNAVPRPPAIEAADASLYLAKAGAVRPFRGAHPRAARPLLAELEALHAAGFAELEAGFAALRSPAMRLNATLRGLNEGLRVALRGLEHPGLYRAAREAR